MYKCEVYGTNSKPGEKLNLVTIKTREKVYTRKYRDEMTGKIEEVEVGRGFEIVKEIKMGTEALALWNSIPLADRPAYVKSLGF